MQLSPRVTFDGPALLQEQADVLSQSSPFDISCLQFLKLKLSAQQKATAQRNQYQQILQEWDSQAEVSQPRNTSNSNSAVLNIYDSVASFPQNGNAYDSSAAASTLRHAKLRKSSAGSNGVGSWLETTSTVESASRVTATRQPATLAVEEVVVVRSSVDAAVGVDDGPASVAKRRSLGREGDPSFDERPAVASGVRDAALPEQPSEEVEMEECPHCGRTFARGRLERHIGMCQRQRAREENLKRTKVNRTAEKRGSVPESSTAAGADSTDTSSVKDSAKKANRRRSAPTSVPITDANTPEKFGRLDG